MVAKLRSGRPLRRKSFATGTTVNKLKRAKSKSKPNVIKKPTIKKLKKANFEEFDFGNKIQ